MQNAAEILSRPICEICNLSISHKVFPDACKIAKLKPIYKKGKKAYPSNYRPICLLPIISKVIDRVAHDQTNKSLSENILYNFQSGFIPNHATNLCLAHLTDKILEGFDEGLLTGMILTYLQKTFDTINHKVLLQKLKAIRFSEQSIQWFRSYHSLQRGANSHLKQASAYEACDCTCTPLHAPKTETCKKKHALFD